MPPTHHYNTLILRGAIGDEDGLLYVDGSPVDVTDKAQLLDNLGNYTDYYSCRATDEQLEFLSPLALPAEIPWVDWA